MSIDSRANQHNSPEITALVETLHQTYARICEITGGQTDAVVHPESGTTYLLPESQGELRRMEQLERRHAAERIAIIDALPAHIALVDADGTIMAVNEAWRRFGDENDLDDPHYLVGRNYIEECEHSRGKERQEAQRIAAGIRSVLSGATNHFYLEYSCHSRQEQRWFACTVTPLDGYDPRSAVVMHIDISDRVRSQRHARELHDRLERLIDQASVGILVHRHFAPFLANQEAARLFGYNDPDRILALGDIRRLYDAEEVPRIEEYYAARLRGENVPTLYQTRAKRQDGVDLVMEIRAFTITWDGEPAVCVMLTDITERLKTEESLRQAQRLEAVGQLTGGVAHDFNNLLTVILGNAEILSQSLPDDPSLSMLADATAKAAERGSELTGRLLAFARQQPLNPVSTDINALIAGLDNLLRRTLGEHIEIGLVRKANLWRAMIDRGQLENAILNLCLNARDAMPEGGHLTIETDNTHLDAAYADRFDEVSPGQYVVIAVSDSGTGMDEETKEHAFEPFFTTKETGKGSGLGLSMVFGFVKQSGGHVRIYSELAEGTTVKLYLPRADVANEPKETASAAARPARGSEKILLVEDDDLVREHVTAQLRGLGYQVVARANGQEALATLQECSEFDILFTDVVMPGGMSGPKLAEEARRLRPDLPVLFTSGYTENAMVHQGRLEDGFQLLAKPYRRQELAKKLREALGKSR